MRDGYHKRWLAENADHVRQYAADYWQRNKTVRQAGDYERLVEWRAKNPEKQRAINARYSKTAKGLVVRLRRWHRSRAAKVGVGSAGCSEMLALFRSQPRCAYCQRITGRMEVDHIQPISCGGADAPHNWAAACKSCNSSKGNREPVAWSMKKFGRVVGPIAWMDAT